MEARRLLDFFVSLAEALNQHQTEEEAEVTQKEDAGIKDAWRKTMAGRLRISEK